MPTFQPKQTSSSPDELVVTSELTPEPTQMPTLIEPPVTETPQPTPVPTTAPVVLDNKQATPVTLESVIESIKQSNNTPGKFVIGGLETYITNMQPGMPISKDHAVMQQVGLWNTLSNFVENTEEDFNKVFSTVLGLFHKHKDGVFHEHYVFRVMSDVTLDKEEIDAFQVLINLLKVTADPVGRQQALKQNVDISRTLANVFSENARQKILGFYGM